MYFNIRMSLFHIDQCPIFDKLIEMMILFSYHRWLFCITVIIIVAYFSLVW